MLLSKQVRRARPIQIVFVTAAVVVIIAGMRLAQPVIVPFLLALFITIVSLPGCLWLQRRGVPAVVAIILTLIVVLGIILLVPVIVGASLQEFRANLPFYQALLVEKEHEMIMQLNALGIDIGGERFIEVIDPNLIVSMFGNLLEELVKGGGNLVMIFLFITFMLAEASWLPLKVQAALGDASDALDRLNEVAKNVRRYIAIKTGISILTGVLVGLGLAMIGLPYAALWGLLGFLFNYIPNLGPVIAGIPAVLLALLEMGWGGALATAVIIYAINQILGGIIEPRIQGQGLGLSTLVVFASVVFWGWVLGIVGALLSPPLTMAVKISLDAYDDSRWLAVLLGGKPDPDAMDNQTTPDGEPEASDSDEAGETAAPGA